MGWSSSSPDLPSANVCSGSVLPSRWLRWDPRPDHRSHGPPQGEGWSSPRQAWAPARRLDAELPLQDAVQHAQRRHGHASDSLDPLRWACRQGRDEPRIHAAGQYAFEFPDSGPERVDRGLDVDRTIVSNMTKTFRSAIATRSRSSMFGSRSPRPNVERLARCLRRAHSRSRAARSCPGIGCDSRRGRAQLSGRSR